VDQIVGYHEVARFQRALELRFSRPGAKVFLTQPCVRKHHSLSTLPERAVPGLLGGLSYPREPPALPGWQQKLDDSGNRLFGFSLRGMSSDFIVSSTGSFF
jgi:hypothetical protein